MTGQLNSVLSSDKLPSLPGVALQVIQLANAAEPDLRELARVIKCDPALTAKILRTVNSSLFGVPHKVADIDRAVVTLGLHTVTNLVLCFSLLPKSTGPGAVSSYLQLFWRGSLTQAVAASKVAKLAGGGKPAELFVAGLLQDVGGLALLSTQTDKYLEVMEEFDRTERPLVEIERDELGVTHVEVSVALFQRWQLPERLQKAVARHHATVSEIEHRATSGHSAIERTLATAAAISEYFWRREKFRAGALVEETSQKFFRLEGEQLHKILEEIAVDLRDTAAMFSLDTQHYPPCDEIASAATVTLARVSKRPRVRNFTKLEVVRQFESDWNGAAQLGKPLGLLLISIDDLRPLIDQHGPQLERQAIQSIASILETQSECASFLARCGDDGVYLLVLPGMAEHELLAVAEDVRRRVATHVLADDLEISASIGVASSEGASFGSAGPGELLVAGESALVEAQRAGGNQVRFRVPHSGRTELRVALAS